MDYSIYIKTALDIIENRVCENVTIHHLASVVGFSSEHFRKVFVNIIGQSVAAYIRERKLCYAAAALSNTEKKITEIAMEYDFSSLDDFGRAFKRTFGETPTLFRQNARCIYMKMIVPCVYGPAVTNIKRATICLSHTVVDGTAVLYGVSKVGYYVEHMEITPFISSLRAILSYMGQQISYCTLMAASGAAFRLIWNTAFWDEANVDLMRMWKHPLLPHLKGVLSAGRECRIILRKDLQGVCSEETTVEDSKYISYGDKESFISLIKSEIDKGHPVIGFGIIGPPEACIITGYKENGEVLLGWNYFQDMIDYAGDIQKEPCGYFIKRDWYDNPNTIAVMGIGELKDVQDEKIVFVDTIDQAIKIMSPRNIDTTAGGLNAFEAWASAISDNKEFPKNGPLPMLYTRLICQTDAEVQIGEGRYYAAMHLERAKELFPTLHDELDDVINIFKHEVVLIEKMVALHEGSGFGEKHITALNKIDIREKIAKLIKQLGSYEDQSIQTLKRILQTIKEEVKNGLP